MPAFNEEEAIADSHPLSARASTTRREARAGRRRRRLDRRARSARWRGGGRRAARARDRPRRTAASAPRWRRASARPTPRSSRSSTPTSLEPEARAQPRAGLRGQAVGAIAGHADVANSRESWIARMQAVRYFVAFRVVQGGRVGVRRGHLLLGLLLRLPAHRDRASARPLGAPDVPRLTRDVRR